MTAAAPCLAGLLSLCFFLLITVWVTPENQLAKLALRGSSVLPQDFRGPQVGFHFRWGGNAQFLCIIQLSYTSFRAKAHNKQLPWVRRKRLFVALNQQSDLRAAGKRIVRCCLLCAYT